MYPQLTLGIRDRSPFGHARNPLALLGFAAGPSLQNGEAIIRGGHTVS